MGIENLEQLKAIIDNAPEGANCFSEYVRCYVKRDNDRYYWWDGEAWFSLNSPLTLRSLSDIKRIVELMESTQGLLQLTAGSPDGYWRNEINAARKALGLKV